MINGICNVIRDNGEIYIFGCTEIGVDIFKSIKKLSDALEIDFIDNDSTLQKNGFVFEEYHCKVFSPDFLLTHINEDDYIVIIASIYHFNKMKEEMIRIGVSEDKIYLPEQIHKKEKDELEKIIARRIPKKVLNIVTDLAEHCNLNCQMCDHFSPLATEKYADINSFEKDFKRLHELFGDDGLTHIDLEGGEPLLNEKICDFIEILRDIFKKTQIKIFTNGIILPQMGEDFWECLHRTDVDLEVTEYPIGIDYDGIEKLVVSKGIRYHIYDGGKIEKKSWHKPLDLEKTQDMYDSFDNCNLANGECCMLKAGRLYPCTIIPNFDSFNKFFNKELDITEKDYVDIYEEITKEDIFKFLCEPVPACSYCKVHERTGGHPWCTTKYRISEWT